MAGEQERDLHAALLQELETNPQAVLQTYQKGRVLDALDGDATTRTSLRSLVAQKFPQAAEAMPETAVARAVAPALAALNKEREEIARERAADAQAKAKERWHEALAKHGVERKDFDAVEKLAIDTANMDPEALAMRWKAQQRPLRSSSGFGRPIIPGTQGDEYFKGILEDPEIGRAHV